ncbi:MAG: hypothetical protein H6828_04895 [Planctomycetes bacterium]|nr:hypothetical protein [Planctomycetota bacterium]
MLAKLVRCATRALATLALAAPGLAQVTPDLVQPPPGALAFRHADALELLDAQFAALQLVEEHLRAMYDLAYEGTQIPFSIVDLAKLDGEFQVHLDAVDRITYAADYQGLSILNTLTVVYLQAGPTSHGYYRYPLCDATAPALNVDTLSISYPWSPQWSLSPLTSAIAEVRGLGLYPNCAYRHYLGAGTSCACNVTYCEAAPNSSGNAARLHVLAPFYDPAYLTNTRAPFYYVSGAPAGSTGVLFYGEARTRLPFGQGLLCAAPPLYRASTTFSLDATGQMPDIKQMPLPASAPPGLTLYYQAWFRDPGFGHGGLTNAVAVTLGP